jgi:hypothetical protein
MDFGETFGDWAICLPPFCTWYDYGGVLVNRDSPNKDLLGPLVEWLTLDCSENGLQYGLSSGTLLYNEKMSVVSGTVLKNADSSREVLGGQNVNTVIYEALQQPIGRTYRSDAFDKWNDTIGPYIKREKSKKTIVEDFSSNLIINRRMIAPNELPDPKAAQNQAHEEPIVWSDKLLFKPVNDIYPGDADRVIGLDLTDSNIKHLEDLLNFRNLKCLYLGSNEITDISCLKELTHLELLDISNNNITDISALNGLTELRELNINKNQISDISGLEGMKNLKHLNASRNNISDIKILSRLTSLETLNLSENKISDVSPLKNLTMLRDVDMEYNDITDISSLRALKKLEILKLNGNEISDISILKGLRNLKDLRLSGSEISDRSPADHVESVTW